jgi:hypothetical protein
MYRTRTCPECGWINPANSCEQCGKIQDAGRETKR